MKSIDWSTIARLPNVATGAAEIGWVSPQYFFDTLPAVLADAPPLPGEEARYAQVLAVIEAAKNDPKLKAAMTEAAAEADDKLVKPLFEFRNYGQQLPHHWSTISNEGRIRQRLLHPHGRRQIEHIRQRAESKRNTSTRTWTRGRPAKRRQPLHGDVRKARPRQSMDSGLSPYTTSITFSSPMKSPAIPSARRTRA